MKKSIFLGLLLFFSLLFFRVQAACPPNSAVSLTSVTSTPRTCGANGTVTASFAPSGSGGNVTLQLISAGSVIASVTQSASPHTFGTLNPGTYQVRVVCAENNNTVYATQDITVGDNYIPISAADISTSVCTNFTAGGTIIVNNVTGGTAPYTYSFYQSNDPAYDDNLSNYTSSNTATVPQFGNYQIRVKDACGNYRTFTRTLQATNTNLFKVYFKITPVCGTAQNNAAYDWSSGFSQFELAAGFMMTIWHRDAAGNSVGAPIFDGLFTGQSFQYPVSATKLYNIRITNRCGIVSNYSFSDPSPEFTLSSSYSGCGASATMIITGQQSGHYWAVPVSVTVRNSSNTVVHTTTVTNLSTAWHSPALPMDTYTVTYTDQCGTSLTKQIANPQNAGAVSIGADYLLWKCQSGLPAQTQIGTTEVELFVNGYLDDKQNAAVTIVSGPSNVGMTGIIQSNGRWLFTNMLPGLYTFSITSCGITNTYPLNVNPSQPQILNYYLNSAAVSYCSGNGNIDSSVFYNGPNTYLVELLNSAGTVIQSNLTGDFQNLPPGTYTTRLRINPGTCGTVYYVDGGTHIISSGTTGPQITASTGIICEDTSGNPLGTGTIYVNLSGVASYTLQYRPQGSSAAWTTITNAPATTVISGLTANTMYELLLTDACGGTDNSNVLINTMGNLTTSGNIHPCVGQPYELAIPFYAGATYTWTNPQGVVVSNTRTYAIQNYTAAYDGTYVAEIRWNNCVTRYVSVTIDSTKCGTPINTNACYRNPGTAEPILDTRHGITALGRAGADNGNWPMVRKGAHTVLEAKTKGFVLNRLTTAQKNTLTPTKGMAVYDTDLDCLSIYDGTSWKCFTTQACPVN